MYSAIILPGKSFCNEKPFIPAIEKAVSGEEDQPFQTSILEVQVMLWSIVFVRAVLAALAFALSILAAVP